MKEDIRGSKKRFLRNFYILHNFKFVEKLQKYYKEIYTLNPDSIIIYILPHYSDFLSSFLLPFVPPSLPFFLSSIYQFFFLSHLRASWRYSLTGPSILNTCIFPKDKDILLYHHRKLLKLENLTEAQYFEVIHRLYSSFSNYLSNVFDS